MVHKSKKLTAVYALIMDLPLGILITVISRVLAGSLAAPMFIRMAILAYVITFFVNFLPAPKWGFDFAIKHSKPGTFKFGLLLNIVVAAVFVVILDLIMTAVGVLVFGGDTFQMYIVSVLGGFIPCYDTDYRNPLERTGRQDVSGHCRRTDAGNSDQLLMLL